jgi:long-chain fatty acid transport protein
MQNKHSQFACRGISSRGAPLAIAIASATLSLGTRANASPLGMYGFGSRSSALEGAVTADVEDFSANYYNPAGLVRGSRLRLDLGYFYATHALNTNGRDNHVDPVHGLSGGIVAPGSIFGLRFAFGLAIHLPDDRISRSRSLPQSQPRWELYDNRVQIIHIGANLAISPVRWLRLGGGISFVSSTRGNLDIYGQIAYPNADASSLQHTVDADLVSVRYPQAGIQVDVLPNLTLGLTYRGSFQLQLSIDALVEGQIVLGRPSDPNATRIMGSYSLSSNSVAVFLPQQAVAGAAWRPVRGLTVMADLTWIDWSAYVNPSAQLQVGLDLRIPPGITGLMLPALPPPTQVVPARFNNTFVPRVGVEYQRDVGVHTVAMRVGYRYEASPVPDQTGPTNFLDSNRHAVAIGAGVVVRGLRPVLGGGLVFDVHGEGQFLESRAMHKDDPADPVGDYVIGGQVWSAGATMGVLF